jgi:hypothetical protein
MRRHPEWLFQGSHAAFELKLHIIALILRFRVEHF